MVGRKKQIERVIQILGRRTKNNPCLIGEPGVGKTAVAEGLAQKISSGDVPETIEGKQVRCLTRAATANLHMCVQSCGVSVSEPRRTVMRTARGGACMQQPPRSRGRGIQSPAPCLCLHQASCAPPHTHRVCATWAAFTHS